MNLPLLVVSVTGSAGESDKREASHPFDQEVHGHLPLCAGMDDDNVCGTVPAHW